MQDRTRAIIVLLLAALLLFGLGAAAGYGGHWYLTRNDPTGEDVDRFGVFWETWRIVEDDFYGDIPQDPAPVYGAVRGAVDTLQDPYTIFVEPQPRALEKAELEGQFGGIGAFVTRGPEGEVVLTPMVDSPAEKAGLHKEDVLMQVDDTAILPDMTTEDVVMLIRGEVDTPVTLTLRRAEVEDPVVVVVTRQVIETPSVDWRVLEQDPTIGYVHVRLFTERTDEEIKRALEDLTEAGVTSLVVDLRDNGGGLLGAAVDVSSQFLDNGVVLYENRQGQSEKSYAVKRGGRALDQPLTVLVNAGTASASEIVAGALQAHQRAPLIGERTFGKGSVQLVYDLSDQSSLHVTVARWLTPDRQQIDGQGLTPDIEVVVSEEDRANGTDPQLKRAVAYLREQGEGGSRK
jgi:carboxyl-terminal processing protease